MVEAELIERRWKVRQHRSTEHQARLYADLRRLQYLLCVSRSSRQGHGLIQLSDRGVADIEKVQGPVV